MICIGVDKGKLRTTDKSICLVLLNYLSFIVEYDYFRRRRVMGARSRRPECRIQSRGPCSLRGRTPERQIHGARAHLGGDSSLAAGSCLQCTSTHRVSWCPDRLLERLYRADRTKNHLRLTRHIEPKGINSPNRRDKVSWRPSG